MFELIRKSFLASLGAAAVTREKVESVTKRLVDENKLSREEAERLANELVDSGQKQWDEFQSKISETIRKGLESLDLITRPEFEKLTRQVKEMEARLAALECKTSPAPETPAT